MLEKQENNSNQEEKFRVIYIFYAFLGLFFVALFIEAIEIIYLLFTRGAEALMKEINTVFVIFFVFLLFSIIWKVIVQRISSTDNLNMESEKNDESSAKPFLKRKKFLSW